MPNLIPMKDLGREKAMYSFLMTPWMQTPYLVAKRKLDLAYLASHITIQRANNPDLASLSDAEITKQVMQMPRPERLVHVCTTKNGYEIYAEESQLAVPWQGHSNEYWNINNE